METELQIGAADGPGSLIGRPTDVVIDSVGRVWITMLDYGFPFVFRNTGEFLQEFGRPGSGPGEFRRATVVAGLPGDSILLQSTPSFLVVGPEFNIDRVIRGPFASWTGHRIVSWPDEILAVKIEYASGNAVAQVMIIDLSGDQIIERDTLVSVTSSTASLYRRAEPAPRGGVWVSETTRYFLRRYGPAGTLEDSLERRAEWFPPGESYGFGTPAQPPTTSVNTIRSDSEGRLWVYIDRPQADWRDAWRGISFPEGVGEVRVSSLPPNYALWRTTVEIIDPEQRRVVVREDLPGHVLSVLGVDRIVTFVELETGVPVVSIHKLSLVER